MPYVNFDTAAAYYHDRYMKNKPRILALQKKYRDTHKSEIAAYHKRYRADGREGDYNGKRRRRLAVPVRRIKHLVYFAIQRAKKKGLPYDEDLAAFLLRQPVPIVCPLLGIILDWAPMSGRPAASVSLDRIRPSRGYTCGNVRIVSQRGNRLRSDASAYELKRLAEDAARLPED